MAKKNNPVSVRLGDGLRERLDLEVAKNTENQADTIRHLIEDGFKYRYDPNHMLSKRTQEYLLMDAARWVYVLAANCPERAAKIFELIREEHRGSLLFKRLFVLLLILIALLITLFVSIGQVRF